MREDTAFVVSKQAVKRIFAFIGITLFIVGGTAGLHMRAATDDGLEQRLLPVAVATAQRQNSYQVQEFYTGRVEARQSVNLAFEQAGKIDAILVDEGDFVAKGALIARLDTALLEASRDQTASALKRISSQIELSRLTEKRQKTLFDQGHSTEQRYDEARLNTEALEAQLAETEAALRSIEISIEKASLYAPFDGQVGARSADIGSVRDAGMAIVALLETTVQQARVSLPTHKIDTLRAQHDIAVLYRGVRVSAELAAIRSDVNQRTRTQDVLLNIRPSRAIAFGELIELSLPEVREREGYWVPTEALVEGRKGLWDLFVVEATEAGDTVVRRSAEILFAETSRVFVNANLGDRGRYIAAGTHRVVPGQMVEAIAHGGE